MKQVEKLYNFIKDPCSYGIRKNTRVYKYICDLVCYGITQTGYSNRNTKHIETWEVLNVLNRLGVQCGAKNVAPRGSACGERVFLKGRVLKDCLDNYAKFYKLFLSNNLNKKVWDAREDFIASLQK